MKKLLIILISLIIFGCSENKPVHIVNVIEEKETVLEEVVNDDLWFRGFVGDEPIHLRLSFLEEQVVGEYFINEDEIIILRGHLEGDMIVVKGTDDVRFILTEDSDIYIGSCIRSNKIESVYAKKTNFEFNTQLSQEVQILEGTYTDVESDYFKNAILTIKPLFEEYIFLRIDAKNGSNESSNDFLLRKLNGKYHTLTDRLDLSLEYNELHELYLEANQYNYNCPEGVSYGNVYSESFKITMPKLGDYFEDPVLIEKMLGNDQSLFTHLIQFSEMEEGSTYFSINGFDKTAQYFKEGSQHFIVVRGQFYEDNQNRIYTNSLDYIPEEVSTFAGSKYILKAEPVITGGILPIVSEDINDFILDGYYIKDKVTGNLNMDTLEDVVLVLDHDIHSRLLLVLESTNEGYLLKHYTETAMLQKDEGGVWGDPYEATEISDHKLIISFYGGSNYRWGNTYTFDALMDYQLIYVKTMSYFTGDGSFEEVEYDLVDQKVIETIGNSNSETKTPHFKIKREYIYLRNFDAIYNIDYGYN